MKDKAGLDDTELGSILLDAGVVDEVTEYDMRIARSVLESHVVKQALADSRRVDWLADPKNGNGNVQLPTRCVKENPHSMRDAIDAAMEQKA